MFDSGGELAGDGASSDDASGEGPPCAETCSSRVPSTRAPDPGVRDTQTPDAGAGNARSPDTGVLKMGASLAGALNTAAHGTAASGHDRHSSAQPIASAESARDAASAESREGPDQPRLVRSGGGEEERFREFVAERWLALLRTAYLLTGDHGHAEDLVQTALIRVHRHWGKIERSGSPEGYVRRIMFNLHTDWWRRFGSRERMVRLTADIEHPASADAYASFDLRDELWEALRALPAKMRATLVLRYFEDLGEAETAQILGCSTGTVKSQTSRGLQRLQQALSAKPSSSPEHDHHHGDHDHDQDRGRDRDHEHEHSHAPTVQPSTEHVPAVPPVVPPTEHILVTLRRPEQWSNTQRAAENPSPRTPSQSSSPQPSVGLTPAVRRLDPR